MKEALKQAVIMLSEGKISICPAPYHTVGSFVIGSQKSSLKGSQESCSEKRLAEGLADKLVERLVVSLKKVCMASFLRRQESSFFSGLTVLVNYYRSGIVEIKNKI